MARFRANSARRRSVSSEGFRSLSSARCWAAWALSTDSSELPLAAATARVSATEAFNFCAQENIQTHSGNGYTWEYDCHLFYRRAKLLSVTIGSLTNLQEKLVKELEKLHCDQIS